LVNTQNQIVNFEVVTDVGK